MGDGKEEKQPLLLDPALLLATGEKTKWKKRGEYNREKAERMRTGRQEKITNVGREGQFRLFSCLAGHKGLH
jgi:hypothetical protein